MDTGEPQEGSKGVDLLLAHCAVLAEEAAAPSPLERLRDAVGEGLARLLVSALAGGTGRGRFRGRL